MNTGFRSLHPVTGLIFYIFVFALSLTASHPIVLSSLFICGTLYNIKLTGRKALNLAIKIILPLIFISALINGLFSHFGSTVIFYLPWKEPFTLEAVVYGIVFAVRAGCMLTWLISFNEAVSDDKIIFLFGRISPKIALILSMALKFIPMIMRQSEEIRTAEKGIGSGTASGSFIKRIKGASKRLSVLVSWSLERGIDTQNSMNARGYGLRGRTSYNGYFFTGKDCFTLVLSVICTVLTVLSKDTLKALYNPQITIPFPGIFDIAVSVFLVIFMLLPLIIDKKEELKWSISV